MRLRPKTYKAGRIMGDVEAVASGRPSRIAKRVANKWIGRNLVRRMWIK